MFLNQNQSQVCNRGCKNAKNVHYRWKSDKVKQNVYYTLMFDG